METSDNQQNQQNQQYNPAQAGQPVPGADFSSDAGQHDYFGFAQTEQHMLDDGHSFIEIMAMNEGAKAQFQKQTQRDMVLEKGSGNARFKIDPAQERHALIRACVTGWNLQRQGMPIPFKPQALGDFLKLAKPGVVEGLEKAIRNLNPWLLGDATVEDIDKQIEELQEMRELAVKRESGEAN